MRRSLLLLAAVSAELAIAAVAPMANATVIADWQFNAATPGGGALADSSGNGYTLTNPDTSSPVTFGTYATPTGNEPATYASFTGDGAANGPYLATTANLNVSGYSELILTWSMQYTGSNLGIVFESSSDYNNGNGTVIVDVDTTTSNTGNVGLHVSATSPGYNTAGYSYNSGTWDTYEMIINLKAPTAAGVIQVYQDGTLENTTFGTVGGTMTLANASVPAGFDFLNAIGVIGGGDNRASFQGNIGPMVLIGVPEPSSFVLVGCAGIAMLLMRLRSRRHCVFIGRVQ